jgi:lipid A 3-O-deacylase
MSLNAGRRRVRNGLWLVGLILATRAFAADAVVPAVLPRYEWEYATGILWKVGGGATPLTYLLVPQIISLKIPPVSERPWAGGTLVLRSRFSLLIEPILRGPEHSFLGTAAAGELEWRSPSRRFVGFFAAGGGFGWIDSKGHEIAGAQGQDFNLNWLANLGVRYRTEENWLFSLGVYFQHISNRGMDRINPGLNAVGPTLAFSHRF